MSSVYEEYKKNGTLEEADKRGVRFSVGHHEASFNFLPPFGNELFPEHYYETHPEFFRLQEDGTRFKPLTLWGQLIYCSRNQDLIETLSQNIIKWISINPNVDIIAMWPSDGIYEQCCCEKCKKYSKVENYAYFQNSIAHRVTKVHPNIKLDMLIYVDLWGCPENVKLEPCLIADEATWHSSGLRHVGKPDGSTLAETMFESNLLSWKNAGAKVVYYDYYMGVFPARQKLMPMADEMQSMCKRFVEKGIMGAGTQIEPYNLWNNIFNFYTYGRTSYDTSLSFDTNLNMFSKIFGEASEHIIKIIKHCEKVLDGQVCIEKAGRYMINNVDKEMIYKDFENALNSVDNKRFRNNIRLMRMSFRYSHLETIDDNSEDAMPYEDLKKYVDKTGEMRFMSNKFDSYVKNDPGYAINLPVAGNPIGFAGGYWYDFE